MWDWTWGVGWGIGLVVLGVLFWTAIIGLVVWLIVRLTRRENKEDTGKSKAIYIARERYARGEITREEFETLKKDLS